MIEEEFNIFYNEFMDGRDTLTPLEVAEQLKITKNTVYELIKRGELESYRVGKKIRVECKAVEALKNRNNPQPRALTSIRGQVKTSVPATEDNLIICGQDMVLDILARRLESQPTGKRIFRSHMGSYNALYSLYLGEVHVATAHIWDSGSGRYNLPFVRRMIPGIPTALIHIGKRWQGFYVKKGNPKGISDWDDLSRRDIRFVNRERGSGTRILLDEILLSHGRNSSEVWGYNDEIFSHLDGASRVSRDEADYCLGCEKTALQIPDIEFIPLQEESYDMVILKENINHPPFDYMISLLQSKEFQQEIKGLGSYNVEDMGKIVFIDQS